MLARISKAIACNKVVLCGTAGLGGTYFLLSNAPKKQPTQLNLTDFNERFYSSEELKRNK